MADNQYHFVTHWRLKASAQEITEIIGDAESLPRWWPSVYLEVKELKQGAANGIGKQVALYTKGWLPYTLRWHFQVTEADPPRGFVLMAEGDFVGRGIWAFVEDGEWVNITYDWQIEAEKPLLKRLSFLLKPVFEQNHLWAMRRGEESLRLELQRRHVPAAAQHTIPAPPPPTPSKPLQWLIYVVTRRPSARLSRQGV